MYGLPDVTELSLNSSVNLRFLDLFNRQRSTASLWVIDKALVDADIFSAT